MLPAVLRCLGYAGTSRPCSSSVGAGSHAGEDLLERVGSLLVKVSGAGTAGELRPGAPSPHPLAQLAFAVMVTALRCPSLGLGKLTSTTPSLQVASTWSAVTPSGSATRRVNDP